MGVYGVYMGPEQGKCVVTPGCLRLSTSSQGVYIWYQLVETATTVSLLLRSAPIETDWNNREWALLFLSVMLNHVAQRMP